MRYYTDVCPVTGGFTFFNGGRKISKGTYLRAFDRICVKPSEFAKDMRYCPEWTSCPLGYCAPLKDAANVFYVLLVHRQNPDNEFAEIITEKEYHEDQGFSYFVRAREAYAARTALREGNGPTEEDSSVPDDALGRSTPDPG